MKYLLLAVLVALAYSEFKIAFSEAHLKSFQPRASADLVEIGRRP